jgi:hypothetical protein
MDRTATGDQAAETLTEVLPNAREADLWADWVARHHDVQRVTYDLLGDGIHVTAHLTCSTPAHTSATQTHRSAPVASNEPSRTGDLIADA